MNDDAANANGCAVESCQHVSTTKHQSICRLALCACATCGAVAAIQCCLILCTCCRFGAVMEILLGLVPCMCWGCGAAGVALSTLALCTDCNSAEPVDEFLVAAVARMAR